MNSMELVAAVAGAFMSFWVFRGYGMDNMLMFLCLFQYRNKREFYELYDMADDEATFTMHAEILGLQSYADFLRLHKAARKTAYDQFHKLYTGLTKLALTRTLPVWLLPAALFWDLWLYYVLVAVGVFVLWVGYKAVIERRALGFYQRSIIGSTLHTYQKRQIQNKTAVLGRR